MIFVFDDEQNKYGGLTALWQGRKILFKNFSFMVDSGWWIVLVVVQEGVFQGL